MCSLKSPTLPSDSMLVIDLQGGDAALLRVMSILHRRQARVRSLNYQNRDGRARIVLHVADHSSNGPYLRRALGRSVDVIEVLEAPMSRMTASRLGRRSRQAAAEWALGRGGS